MKKFISIILITLFAFNFAIAQGDSTGSGNGLVNKNGVYMLPEQGDIAIGISMSPIFNYFGNFFNGTQWNGSPYANFNIDNMGSNTILVKYFLSDNSAFRLHFEFSSSTTTDSYYIQDDSILQIDPLSNAQVVDIYKYMSRQYILGLGYEQHRGKTRLQGIYGADLLMGYGNSLEEFLYGNPMSMDNPMPSTTDWGINLYNNGRILRTFDGEDFSVGVRAFIGFEYFILPKLSLGANFGWGFMLHKDKQQRFEYEYWDVDHHEMNVATYPGDVYRTLGATNPYTNFYLMFHF